MKCYMPRGKGTPKNRQNETVRSPVASPVFRRRQGVTRSYAWDALQPYKKGFHLGFHNSLSFSTSTDRQLQQTKKNFEELHRKFSIFRMKVFGSLAVVAITLQLSNALFFGKGGWGSPISVSYGGGGGGGDGGWGEGSAVSSGGGWGGWGGDEGSSGGGGGGGGGWGEEGPKVIETHRHVHKVHHHDTHEKRVKTFDHHEHKIHEHNKQKKVIYRDHLHKHNLAIHTVHQKNLHQHLVHQHNVHKHNLHVVKVHEPIIHQYHKTQQKLIPTIQEIHKLIPRHQTVHKVHEHHENVAPVILDHNGWGSDDASSGGSGRGSGWAEEANS